MKQNYSSTINELVVKTIHFIINIYEKKTIFIKDQINKQDSII